MKQIFILIFVLTICGCEESKSNISISPSPTIQESNEKDLLKIFNTSFPDAEIVETASFDIDNDHQDDLVVIFNNPNESGKMSKSNISFITRKSNHSLDIASGKLNYQFADASPKLKMLKNPTRACVTLHDSETNKDIDFEIIITLDKSKNETIYKINAKESGTATRNNSNS